VEDVNVCGGWLQCHNVRSYDVGLRGLFLNTKQFHLINYLFDLQDLREIVKTDLPTFSRDPTKLLLQPRQPFGVLIHTEDDIAERFVRNVFTNKTAEKLKYIKRPGL